MMARKKWSAQTEITPALVRSREKRKWQIALRRYVIHRQPSSFYAPYFGLDIPQLRVWLEHQFPPGMDWEDFGRGWQFEHRVPVHYFDFEDERDLRLCWNFINLAVGRISRQGEGELGHDLLSARLFFQHLARESQFPLCQQMLARIEELAQVQEPQVQVLADFLEKNKNYLERISSFGSFEFDWLNKGKNLEEIEKEREFLKKYGK